MSTRPTDKHGGHAGVAGGGQDPARRPITITRLQEKKALGEPIVMITAYDYPSATVVDEAGVDLVLVGDSAAMVVLGYPNTTPVSMDEMVILASAVRRGLKHPLLIGDMPFGSYEASNEQAIKNAQRFVKEAGCDAVKLERGGASAERARAIVESGIPVMGHIGLTPQNAVQLGGYRAQGRTAAAAKAVIEEALELQAAGCFAIVLECVPSELADALMPLLGVPAIGIGAGPQTDGQVLVYHDLLGIWDGRPAKFVRQYADVRHQMVNGVTAFAKDVRSRAYPAPEHEYEMSPDEASQLAEWARDHVASLHEFLAD
ncbi:MAG: 3-methyl-2-oxobutanoate hydroxymethyltransferase [Actinobacteria bacterium]|nr:3-methyl-2-oxobutanoate hydroxymethyltransferase [Actinomycetota bacterium]